MAISKACKTNFSWPALWCRMKWSNKPVKQWAL